VGHGSVTAAGTLVGPDFGDRALALMRELAPFRRSITGDGLRQTLRAIADVAPLRLTEVPSGTRVLDWTVPREWRLREAWIRGPQGETVADATRHPLEVVNYSRPFRGELDLADLQAHLHSDPARPAAIPYRTSYYADAWGFCLPHARRAALPPGTYEVCVDAELVDGSLTYGEALVPGRSRDEFLVFTHACHPGLVNDNLTGLAVAALLARALVACAPDHPLRACTYRFVFGPGTIGAIAWLAQRRDVLPRVRHGLVLGLLGDAAPLTYKRSRRGTRGIDAIGEYVVSRTPGGRVLPFTPYGYDERQLCSPGFDLPVGRLTRSVEGEYPQYHSSADDFEIVTGERLRESAEAVAAIFAIAATNARYLNLKPEGEPQLGRHGLYSGVGGSLPGGYTHALLWLLSAGDGTASLLDVAVRAGLDYGTLAHAADALEAAGLLQRLAAAEERGTVCGAAEVSGESSGTRGRA
jgi:aminopeptidase-like protein